MYNTKRKETFSFMFKNFKRDIFPLAWPIFIEIGLFMIMGNIDVVMLSRVSETVVSAVGNVNQVFNLIALMFSVVTSASAILISQSIGAKKTQELPTIVSLAFTLNMSLAFLLGLGVLAFGSYFLMLINVPIESIQVGKGYMMIVGSTLFVHAGSLVLTTTLRSHKHTKEVMHISVLMNILNVIGNYTFLFGPLAFLNMGVVGVALSTAVSRTIGLILNYRLCGKLVNFTPRLRHLKNVTKELLFKMIRLGSPAAIEPLSYQLVQVIMFSYINSYGHVAINTRVYVQTVTWFVYLSVLAIAQASLIMVGEKIGQNRTDEARSMVFNNLKISLMISFTMSLFLAINSRFFIGMFTDNEAILQLASTILWIDVILEIGRTFNLVLILSARGAGDVRFPMVIAIIVMWIVGLGTGVTLATVFNMQLVGIWIGLTCDEWVRGLLMMLRWRGEKWKQFKMV
jgi:putative MATE family efflux protein